MKIKILRGDRGRWYHNTDNIGKEFCVIEYWDSSTIRFRVEGCGWVDKDDCVITELPKEFCVNNCEDTDRDKWIKYIWWLNKTYDVKCTGHLFSYYGIVDNKSVILNNQFGTELHIDDMIKHIDFYSEPMVVESEDEFDMTTNTGRLAYAKRNYPVGTKYKSIVSGQELIVGDYDGHLNGQPENIWLVYYNGKWAEIIDEVKEEKMETNLLELIRLFPELPTDYAKKLVQKALEVKEGNLINLSKFINNAETTFLTNYDIIPGNRADNKADYVWRKIYDFKNKKTNMETQKLSRKGLKEIHSVACSNWKGKLEGMGIRNPLEDYIELTQEEVDAMFTACSSNQLPIVSKYLKQDDGSVDLETLCLRDNEFLTIRNCFEYTNKAFWLNDKFNWEIKKDSDDELCLIPTKKK